MPAIWQMTSVVSPGKLVRGVRCSDLSWASLAVVDTRQTPTRLDPIQWPELILKLINTIWAADMCRLSPSVVHYLSVESHRPSVTRGGGRSVHWLSGLTAPCGPLTALCGKWGAAAMLSPSMINDEVHWRWNTLGRYFYSGVVQPVRRLITWSQVASYYLIL